LVIENLSLVIVSKPSAGGFSAGFAVTMEFPKLQRPKIKYTLSLTDSRLIRRFQGHCIYNELQDGGSGIENGRVQAAGAETLPGKARGLFDNSVATTVKSMRL